MATLEYGVFAHELWQALADEWIPCGVIRILKRIAKQPKADIVDNSDGVSATQSDFEQSVDEDDESYDDEVSDTEDEGDESA